MERAGRVSRNRVLDSAGIAGGETPRFPDEGLRQGVKGGVDLGPALGGGVLGVRGVRQRCDWHRERDEEGEADAAPSLGVGGGGHG